jgi:TonB-dependent SusC/RagA subfamily outer membrane receptor
VTDGAGGAPLEGAQVRVDGTNIGTITGDDGRYVISRIQPGQFQLRVIRIGYLAALKPATVRANESATVDFALTRAPYQLEGVVTTATGQTLTRELGNSIAKIGAAKLVENSPHFHAGRAEWAHRRRHDARLERDGRWRRASIRGLSSAVNDRDPRGRRARGQASPALAGTLFVGGGRPSFLNNLNPDEIESLEIVKGPSAATLYGTQAANGVIVITTKRGKAGPPKWTLYGEGGTSYDPAEYPGIYYTEGRSPSGATRGCLQWQQAVGDCTITQAYSRNLLEDAATTPTGAAPAIRRPGQRRHRRRGTSSAPTGGARTAAHAGAGSTRYSRARSRTSRAGPADPNQLTKSACVPTSGCSSPQADLSVSSGVNSYNLLRRPATTCGGYRLGLFGNPGGARQPVGLRATEQASPRASRATNQFLNSATACGVHSFLSSRAAGDGLDGV